MKKEIGEHIKKAGPVFGTVGAAGGFIADVLQPIAPFSSYLFFASATTSVGILVILVVKAALRTKILPAFFISISLMVVSGSMYFLQKDETRQSGVLANAIPGIKGLQSAMGIMQKDISEIKESTKRIEESSARTAETVKVVEEITKETAEATKKIAGSIDVVFNELLKGGGIIKTPTKPEEFYANARMYEQKGDSGNARRSYVKFFGFDLDYIDPHLRYQKYLKIQEGKEGAREVYSEMKEDSKSFVTEYASILLFSRKTRIKKLGKFMEKHPEFGPGYFELSKEFSEVRLGEQTQKDKGNEKKYLKKFYELHEQGKFLKYFMDKDMVSKFLNNAETRMTALKTFDDSILKNPIKLQAFKTNQGWSLNATTIDAITELFYRFEGDDKFTSTGFLDFLDSRTGKKMPSPMINAPSDLGKTKIFFKYKALGGEERGPFEVVFDPGSALRDSMISTLKQTPGSWATYRSFQGRDLFYLRPTSGCSVDKVIYAWDNDKNLDKEFPIFECDSDNPHAQPRDYKNYLDAPPGTRFIAVQVFFKDGTKSKVRITKR
tara:strand:- start:484 stop:2133 length:1650 start_codon:yes stop_codon:yes gene_type:complete